LRKDPKKRKGEADISFSHSQGGGLGGGGRGGGGGGVGGGGGKELPHLLYVEGVSSSAPWEGGIGLIMRGESLFVSPGKKRGKKTQRGEREKISIFFALEGGKGRNLLLHYPKKVGVQKSLPFKGGKRKKCELLHLCPKRGRVEIWGEWKYGNLTASIFKERGKIPPGGGEKASPFQSRGGTLFRLTASVEEKFRGKGEISTSQKKGKKIIDRKKKG